MKHEFNLFYAMRDGVITHISEAVSNPDSSCVCPSCSEKLIVAKDKSGAFCFAHESNNPCEYGFRYSVCCAAAEMLSQGKAIKLPSVKISLPSGKRTILLAEETEVIFDSVELDYSINENYPVIIAGKRNKRILLTFFTEETFYYEDISNMTEYGISILAINLNGLDRPMSKSQIEKYILERTDNKTWLFNVFENDCFNMLKRESERYNIIRHGDFLYTSHCPLSVRTINNKPCANFIEDCHSGCKYYICRSCETNRNRYIRSDFTGDYIICIGQNRQTPEDCIDKTLHQK